MYNIRHDITETHILYTYTLYIHLLHILYTNRSGDDVPGLLDG